MKSKHIAIALIGIVALIAAVLIIREREPYAFEEASRFARLGPEGNLSEAQVQEILQQSSDGPVVVSSVQNDELAPLSQIAVIKPKQSKPDPDLNELRPLPRRGGGGPKIVPPGQFKDPVLQESVNQGLAPALNIPSTLQNFEGINNVNGVLPPDTNGDVGPNHYVQWVNLSFAIYSKTGTLLYGPAAGNTLWSGFGGACQTSNDGDPIVQYDHLADRWMMSQFALPNYPSGPFYQCIAVSQTGDPTGAWYRYQFQISATKLNDYPHFGVWSDGYYMSINQFAGNNWGGAGAVAFERDKMLQGLPAQAVYFDLYSVDPNLGGMLPTDLDGQAPPAGTPNYFMEADDNGYGFPQDQLEMWAFSVNWSNPGASTFTHVTNLATAAFDSNMCNGSRNCIRQQGTTRRLDAIADRLMYRLQYRNFGSYQTIVANHTVDVNSTDRAGIRWYELRNSGGGWSIYQQGTFSPDSVSRWMGSAAMDASGNIGLGYSASTNTMYPAIRYTGRLAGDPLGTLSQGEGTLFAGTGAQTHSASRWGDYSSLSVDPVDGCTFWYTNEYIQTTGQSPWRTRIGSFQLPGCGSGSPTPTPVPPTNTPVFPTPTNTGVPPTPTNTGVPPTPTNTGVPPTATNTPPPTSGDVIYISSTSAGNAGGVAFADEDILKYETATGTWSLYFDGSDVGLSASSGTDVAAFRLMPDGSILFSFVAASNIPGLGTVDDSDIVRFIPTSLGDNTAGTFEWYFDGSDVGLTRNSEDIDAVGFAPDGRLLISTTGSFSVPGASGADEDIVAFTPTSLGSNTSGTWSLYFDGSDVGLNTSSSEDLNGASVDPVTGQIYLTTVGNFSVTGVSGTGGDIFICTPSSLGSNTACTFSSYWVAANNGFGGEIADGIGIEK